MEREGACAASERMPLLRERARVVREVSRRLRESQLVVLCAWCRRAGDGAGCWAHLTSLELEPRQITASICPCCLKRVRLG
jgi:hypothetical protein